MGHVVVLWSGFLSAILAMIGSRWDAGCENLQSFIFKKWPSHLCFRHLFKAQLAQNIIISGNIFNDVLTEFTKKHLSCFSEALRNVVENVFFSVRSLNWFGVGYSLGWIDALLWLITGCCAFSWHASTHLVFFLIIIKKIYPVRRMKPVVFCIWSLVV